MISGECLVQHPDLRAPEWDLDRLSFKPVLLCWCLSRGPTWPIAYDPQRLLVKAIRSIRSSKCKQTSQLSPCENKVSAACCVPFSHSIVVFLHFSCYRWIMIKLIQAWFLISYPESTASAATSLALLWAALPNIGHRGSPWGPP